MKKCNDEEWLDIRKWEGFYQVSSKGRVRSLTRTIRQKSRWGEQLRTFPGKMLKLNKCTNNYTFVQLSKPGFKAKCQLVHRLVAEAFLGPAPDKHEVCHKNGDRSDNRALNLRWGTRKSNHADKILHGTDNRGENNHMCKLREKDVIAIRRSLLPLKALAVEYKVSEPTISDIRNYKSWTWLRVPPSPMTYLSPLLIQIRSTEDGLYAWDLHDGPDGAIHESGRAPTIERCLTEIARARIAIAIFITEDTDTAYQPSLPLHFPESPAPVCAALTRFG